MADKNEKFKGVFNGMRAPGGAAPQRKVSPPKDTPTHDQPIAPPFRTGRPKKSDDDPDYAWSKGKGYHTSVVFDLEQYAKMKEHAYQERLSFKSFLEKIVALGLKQYEKNGLK